MQSERARPWTAPETAVFRRELARTDRRVHTELTDQNRRLAVQRDSERAAAWSEPVRRTAQPTSVPPGVAYHRLSADEHRWIFDELITPTVLANVTPRDDPRAVYVIGQPGAGKLAAARMVRRAMRPGTTKLVGDDFKASHPDYFPLLRDDPHSAGAAIRTDYRAWFSQAEEHVRHRRGDVLIEAAPGSVDEFLRFTTRSGHDTCFQALADIVAVAKRHPQFAAITVIGRDGQALMRHEAGSAGRASWALAAERLRPYTEQEARAFLQLHRVLRRALPRHRSELDDIVALARPLMPPHMQPVRIARPNPPVWPLPMRRQNPGYDSLSSLSRAA
ncbi:zeta toxin family protein [Streptomyces griseorubiginosus]|uniref:zeta toxin family protein n=1 Tax=Streptomyces griseorubiginosus TaxID=67304 RepID=UPI0035CCDDC9